MNLQTKITIPSPSFQITHKDKIMSIGSCFAQNMSAFLVDSKFQIQSNPFGILYHPLAISKALNAIIENKSYHIDDLFYHNERWHSFDHHSDFSHPNKEIALQNINTHIQEAHQHLSQSNVLIITLGTAFAFFQKENQEAVANCHKVPSTFFEKRMTSISEIIEALGNAIKTVQVLRPNLNIILTVSPIRHMKEGAINNQKSKATLLLAIHELVKNLPRIYYFPAYELVLDELRDYRFYAKDLIHLNEIGVEYVKEKFFNTFFSSVTQQHINNFEKLRKAFAHRPFNPNSEQHQAFLKKQYALAASYQKKFPYLDF